MKKKWIVLLLLFSLNIKAEMNCDRFKNNAPSDWSSVDKSDFPLQLIALFDASGSVVDNAKKVTMEAWYLDSQSNDRTWRWYWYSVFNNRLPDWLNNSLGKQQADYTQALKNAESFYYGFETRGGTWAKDFITHINSQGDLHNTLLGFSREALYHNLGRKNWGLSSAIKPMALQYYSRCQQQNKALVSSLYLLNLTDNEANRASDKTELNELKQVEDHARKGATQINDFNFLWKTIQKTTNYYYFSPVSSALFKPRLKSYETDIDRMFSSECSVCRRSLYTSLTEVKPAIPLQANDFYLLDRAVIFEYTAAGYHADIALSLIAQDESVYQLKNICLKPDDAQFQWQCKTPDDVLNYAFDLPITDETENTANKPKSLLIKSLYIYQPNQLSIGLVVDAIQENKINYEQAIKLKDDSIVTHQLMAQYPGDNQGQVRDKENQKIEAARLFNEFITYIVLIVTVAIVVAFLGYLIWKFRRKYPKAKIRLSVCDKAEHPETNEKIVELRSYNINLNDLRKHPEIVIGHCLLENTAGTNRERAWEKIKIPRAAIKIKYIDPKDTQSVKAPDNILVLGDENPHLDLQLFQELSWPIIFDANKLQGLNEALFPAGAITILAGVEVDVSLKNKKQANLEQLFSITVTIEPATYEYTTEIQ